MNFVSIDFETATGKRNSACAVGVCVVEEGEIAEVYSALIRPVYDEFSWFNTSLHGICLDDVIDEPDFEELWPSLHELIQDRPVIAHNASFDISVLRSTLSHYDIHPPRLRYCCTCNMAKRLWPRLSSHKLNIVADHLGIELNHNDAGSDATVCAKIALRAIEECGCLTFLETVKMIRLPLRWL